MNCHYTDEQLKEDVERSIGIRARDIDKIQFCGLWHIRFRAFGTDFYYYRADSDDTVHLVSRPGNGSKDGKSPGLVWPAFSCFLYFYIAIKQIYSKIEIYIYR